MSLIQLLLGMESFGATTTISPNWCDGSTLVSLHFPSLRWVIIGFYYLLPLIHRLIAYLLLELC